MRMLGRYATARRPGELVFLTAPNTALASMIITEVETMDVFGGRATISAGELAGIFGVPIVRSEQMVLADNDGRVTSGGNATDTGRIVCFNTSQYRVGFRRQIQLEPDREPGKNQTTLYVTFRIALAMRDSTRANQRHTSILYNIGSVT